jgi:hypothetical protein
VANKNVTISTNVAPGSVTFNGGVGTTYVVSGTGGITGTGPVTINSGTVRLQNTGNAYPGTTTIAAGARLETATMTLSSVVANGTLALSGNQASTLIDDFNDGNIAEYTTTTVLDNTPPAASVGVDDVKYSSTGSAITANGFQNGGGPGPEQALALRAALLGIGQTLVVDANFNSATAAFAVVGVAIADNTGYQDAQPGGNQTNGDWDSRKSYITSSMRLNENPDGFDGRYFKTGGTPTTVSATPAGVGTITQLWITRTGTNDYTVGYSKDNMATRVTGFTAPGMDWTPNSVGFYADIRGNVLAGIGAMDNLRIAPSNHLQINGDFTLASTGTLELDLAQDTIESISVSGTALLQGTIDVNAVLGFTPVVGHGYTIFTAALGITDAGATYDLPANCIAQIVGSTSLVLTFSQSGDFNGDTFVNAADYVTWRKSSTDPLGYTAWRENFGTAGAGGASGLNDLAAVPEPSTMMTLILACCFAAVWKRPRMRSAN